MKKILVFLTVVLIVNVVQAQPLDYDNLDKESKDIAVQALATVKPSTKKWVEATILKHPPGKFDTSWVKIQALAKFGTQGKTYSDLFSLMMAYQQLVNKEAREDRKIKSLAKQEQLGIKEQKLATENKRIDQQKQEAREKADNNMDAATTQLQTGIVSSVVQVGGGQAKDTIRKSPGIVTKEIPQQNLQEQADEKKSGADHKKATKDNLKKILDLLAEIKKSSTI